MRRPVRLFVAGAMAVSVVAFTGCTSGPAPKSEAKRESLSIDCEATIKRMNVADPGLDDFLDRAYGYAVFPSIGKGGLVVGGSYGRGEVYQGGRHVGYADVTAISAGLLAGGQTISQLIVFATEQPFNQFTRGEWGFGANASVVALKAGAAKSAQFKDGVVTFVDTRGGLMGDLSLEGQKFRYAPASGSSPTTARTATYEERESPEAQQQRQQDQQQRSDELRDDARDAQPAAEPQPANRDPAIRGEAEIAPDAVEKAAEPQQPADPGAEIRGEVEVGPDAADKPADPQPQGTSGQAGETK